MKNIATLLLIFITVFFNSLNLKADEGMWLINLIEKLNYSDMKEMGLELTAEEIYSLNNASLKDAIVSFGGFCTASVVSSEGLLLTNHHCGFSSIAQHTTLENNYIDNGFWSNSMNEELPVKGLFVKFLIRIEDITEQVLSKVKFEMTEIERSEAIRAEIAQIIIKATEGTHYKAEIKDMFFENNFYLFIYEQFNDVRLVAAPPSSIGHFGGQTDNWMWPRHTGDFSLFRVYSSADGKPTDYSKDNIPLKPKKWLPISLKGFEENDFTMLIGYPGRTSRHISSYDVKASYEFVNPAIIKIREAKLSIILEDMARSEKIRIKYADKYATVANYYKYFIGQNKGISKLNVIERKRIEEDEFETWVNNPEIIKRDYYADAIPKIMMTFRKMPTYLYVRTYLREAILRGSDVVSFAVKFKTFYEEIIKSSPNITDIEKLRIPLLKEAEQYFKNYSKSTERKIFSSMVKLYGENVNKDFHPPIFKLIEKKYNNDYQVYADMVFQTSILTDSAKCINFLNRPLSKTIEDDAMIVFAVSCNNYYNFILNEIKSLNAQLNKGMRQYTKGKFEMDPAKKYYPDANSTMRLTYGKISGYKPADAVSYDYITYIDGLINKEDNTNHDFVVPEKLKQLYESKDFGQYTDKTGNLPVCFLSNLDITGGNSGSPVLNGKGEIIGITFDANWEAMSMDITYEPEIQRAVNVDIRYVMFIIDKFANANQFINEIEIRK